MRPLLVCVLLAAALPLAAVTLQPEIVLDPATSLVPTRAIFPHVASNGRDTLAMWLDLRAWPTVPLRAMRLRGEVPIDPQGFDIASGAFLGVALATDGDAYLAVYSGDGFKLHTARIEDGRVTHRTMPGEGNVRDLASDGTTYCALIADGPSALFLDRNGERLAEVQLPEDSKRIIAIDGRYWLIRAEWNIELIPLTQEGLGAPRTIVITDAPYYFVAMAGGGQMLLAWHDRYEHPVYVVVNAEGDALHAPRRLPEAAGRAVPPSLAWDGREFLLSWTKTWNSVAAEAGKMVGIRIDAGGTQRSKPFPVAGYGEGFVSAFNGRESVWIADESMNEVVNHAVTARAVPELDEYTIRDGTLLTAGGKPQSGQAVAATKDTVLAVWEEEKRRRGALRHADGTLTRLELTAERTADYGTAIAASDELFLAVWASGSPYQLTARRIRTSGEILDPEPIVIRTGGGNLARMASDGTNFLVTWVESRRLYGATVSRDGHVGTPVELAQVSEPADVTLTWAGDAYVLTWAEQLPKELRTVPVSRTGQPLEGWSLLAYRTGNMAEHPAIGGNGRGALLVWAAGDCIRGLTFTAGGRPMGPPRTLACNLGTSSTSYFTFDVTWSDGAYTVLRSSHFEADSLRGLRVTADGTVRGDSFGIAPPGDALLRGAAWTNGRLFVFYDRVVPEEPYVGVRRVFLRPVTLDSGPRRQRAVRP